jgi:hypothetical protein
MIRTTRIEDDDEYENDWRLTPLAYALVVTEADPR